MYISEVLTKTKKGEISHRCILLRESYRENGKVKNRTIANLTHCNKNEIAALRLALKHKDDLGVLKSIKGDLEIKQGMSVGAVSAVYQVAKKLGIEKALGYDRADKLALWQIIARVINRGSCLSAVRLAQTHAACDVLGMRTGFNEDHLYKNLEYLADNQKAIEKRLFKLRRADRAVNLFLYDVTSSYLEGMNNELADWGYNRDKKSGKKQLVIGLLCDDEGIPVSIEVFPGNSLDFDTFGSQVKKAAEDFCCKRVTFVGDRGMIKSGQIAQLEDSEFNYITAITKPQIEKLLKEDVFNLELFDKDIVEVALDGIRYILRRNPYRAEEIERARIEKKEAISKLIKKKNKYLAEHPQAKTSTAFNEIADKIKRLKAGKWLSVDTNGRNLELIENEIALKEESLLDGCYVIKSNLPKDIDKQIIHDRYKDLTEVEQAFRTCKTAMLEIRPWYVWTEKSTRGHAFVVMLSYLIVHYLQKAWADLDVTVEEGLTNLSMLCSMEVNIKDEDSCHLIPDPSQMSTELLKSADIVLPKAIPNLGVKVVSRKKLPMRRK